MKGPDVGPRTPGGTTSSRGGSGTAGLGNGFGTGVDWFSGVARFGTYGDVASDGSLGDCALAAVADILQIQQRSGPLRPGPFVAEYDTLARIDGEPPGAGAGLPVGQVLAAWSSSGIAGTVEGSAPVGIGQGPLEAALAGGPLYVALALPAPGTGPVNVVDGVSTAPWTTARAPLGYGGPGGHAAVAAGFDSRYVYLVTWGYVVPVTWAFWETYAEGAWQVTR